MSNPSTRHSDPSSPRGSDARASARSRRVLPAFAGAALLAAVLTGCGGGGGASTNTVVVPSGTVSGSAAKGLLLNAPVNFYAVGSNGVVGTTSLGSTRTDSTTGAFSSTISSSGPVVVAVTTDGSTQMLDELSGVAGPAPSGLVLHAVFDSLTNLQPVAVTPLTEMAYQTATASTGGLTTTNIDAANNAVGTLFLNGAPILSTLPVSLAKFATATVAQQAQAKLLTALAVASNAGTATGASGNACSGTYAQELVCMIGGLGGLLKANGAGSIALTANAGYLSSAYASLDTDTVTVNGGQLPSVLGLDKATTAETALATAFQQQDPLPGFSAGATPLANTKALVANIRTNILDQSTTQSFGYQPTLSALSTDLKQNVAPVLEGTTSLLGSAYIAAGLIQLGQATSAEYGVLSPYLNGPAGMASDANGNIYLASFNNNVVLKLAASGGAVTLYAGIPGPPPASQTNGAAAQATFGYPLGVTVDSAGNVFVTDLGTVREISAGGTVSTLASGLQIPTAITIDGSNNLWILDSGAIEKIGPGAVVTTLISTSSCSTSTCIGTDMQGIAVDGSGNLYVTRSKMQVVQKITPAGTVSVLAGQFGVRGDSDGTGSAAAFSGPHGITIDGAGNLYVSDTGNAAIRKITPAGVVTTVAATANSTAATAANAFGGILGLALGSGGTIYVSDNAQNAIKQVSTAGVVSTVAHGTVMYQGNCGYDPMGLNTAANVALCRYNGAGQDQLLLTLTLTMTGAGTYTVQTQPLTPSPGASPANQILANYALVSSAAPSSAEFNVTATAAGAQSASFTGPYYVSAAGGQITGALNAAESSNWNPSTATGTITLGGTLSGGSGGVSLVNATIGSDTSITLQDAALKTYLTAQRATPELVSAAQLSGTVDLKNLTTNAFSYAAMATVGAPVTDKSQTLTVPSSVNVTGSISQIGSGGTTPIFDGSASFDIQGFPAFDITQPYGAANFFTVQGQVNGTLSFGGGRTLTVSAAVNGSQKTPTPTTPDSLMATYSYTTPSGTAQLNATGQYDATNGFSGSITNNAGVTIAVKDPIGGTWSGTVTASGTATATIQGGFVYYSDSTSESLF